MVTDFDSTCNQVSAAMIATLWQRVGLAVSPEMIWVVVMSTYLSASADSCTMIGNSMIHLVVDLFS